MPLKEKNRRDSTRFITREQLNVADIARQKLEELARRTTPSTKQQKDFLRSLNIKAAPPESIKQAMRKALNDERKSKVLKSMVEQISVLVEELVKDVNAFTRGIDNIKKDVRDVGELYLNEAMQEALQRQREVAMQTEKRIGAELTGKTNEVLRLYRDVITALEAVLKEQKYANDKALKELRRKTRDIDGKLARVIVDAALAKSTKYWKNYVLQQLREEVLEEMEKNKKRKRGKYDNKKLQEKLLRLTDPNYLKENFSNNIKWEIERAMHNLPTSEDSTEEKITNTEALEEAVNKYLRNDSSVKFFFKQLAEQLQKEALEVARQLPDENKQKQIGVKTIDKVLPDRDVVFSNRPHARVSREVDKFIKIQQPDIKKIRKIEEENREITTAEKQLNYAKDTPDYKALVEAAKDGAVKDRNSLKKIQEIYNRLEMLMR